MVLIYALTIFLSAFLLFQVELVIAKHILPWFGGTPAVWTTCMLFFQVLLMAGYAYSHLIVKRLRSSRQARLHVAILAASLCVLGVQALLWSSPVLPGDAWKPDGSDYPVLRILGLLGVAIGLPFFILSTTSSLLQAWFARTNPGRSPYRLYALSNAGSMLALVSYPFVVEPNLTLGLQADTWAAGYVVFALGCAVCGLVAGRVESNVVEAGPDPPEPDDPPADGGAGPGAADRLLWVALPAIPSVLLLGTTNHISEEIAVVPFLWVMPL
ncbi:MAG: ferrichrome ABC transporter permease, partial [Planctomycetota bacterium]